MPPGETNGVAFHVACLGVRGVCMCVCERVRVCVCVCTCARANRRKLRCAFCVALFVCVSMYVRIWCVCEHECLHLRVHRQSLDCFSLLCASTACMCVCKCVHLLEQDGRRCCCIQGYHRAAAVPPAAAGLPILMQHPPPHFHRKLQNWGCHNQCCAALCRCARCGQGSGPVRRDAGCPYAPPGLRHPCICVCGVCCVYVCSAIAAKGSVGLWARQGGGKCTCLKTQLPQGRRVHVSMCVHLLGG